MQRTYDRIEWIRIQIRKKTKIVYFEYNLVAFAVSNFIFLSEMYNFCAYANIKREYIQIKVEFEKRTNSQLQPLINIRSIHTFTLNCT